MTDGPPAAATSARFVNLPLSPSKAKTTILSSSWNPTYSMSDIVHPPSPSAVGHARPQQSSPLINVYFTHFGAKPDQKICRRSGGDAEFMEDPLHGRLNGIVVEIDGLWIVCAARGSEWLSGGEQGFDGFVVEDEERGHRLETGLHRLVAASVADSADDVLAAEFLQII